MSVSERTTVDARTLAARRRSSRAVSIMMSPVRSRL